jgi:SAM-dependent methyltransferase
MTTPHVWTVEPFRMGTPREFARLRELLGESGYTEPLLREGAGVPAIHFFPAFDKRRVFLEVRDAQSLFVRLFFDGDSVPWSVVRSVLSTDEIATLEALDIIHTRPDEPDHCAGKVTIYPIDDLYVASDRLRRFDTATAAAPADLVFPPITGETYLFLRLMPRERCESFLDLCSGTGVAGLLAAKRFAGKATAVDITERSRRFAAFNAALNDLPNLVSLEGDVYAPVAGQTFDMIVAHPPYVPSFETQYVFRDGGEDGEQVTRRILAGLPTHLRPGGQFFCNCLITDREGAPLEERVREVLGEDEGEFDLLIAQRKTLDPLHFVTEQAREGRATFESLQRWNDTFKRLEVEQLVLATVVIQRRATDRPVVTSRRMLSDLTAAPDLQWVLRWLVQTAGWDAQQMRQLLGSRPRVLPRTELRSRSVLRDGQWSVEECMLVTHAPFAVEAACPNWYATFLQWCDGRMTAREHLQFLRDTKVVPDSAPEDVFATMLRQLLDAGLIEIDEFKLPDATAMRETATRERASGTAPVERAD